MTCNKSKDKLPQIPAPLTRALRSNRPAYRTLRASISTLRLFDLQFTRRGGTFPRLRPLLV